MKRQQATCLFMALGIVALLSNIIPLEASSRAPYRYQATTYQFPVRVKQKTKKAKTVSAHVSHYAGGYASRKNVASRKAKRSVTASRYTPTYVRSSQKRDIKHLKKRHGHYKSLYATPTRRSFSNYAPMGIKKNQDSNKSALCPECKVDFLEECPACSQQAGKPVMFCPSCDAGVHDKRSHWQTTL